MSRRHGFCFVLVAVLALFACTQACSTPHQLKQNVDSVLSHFASDLARTSPGIFIQALNSTTKQWQNLYTLRHADFHTPASNNKVLTTAAIMSVYEPNHRMKTPVFLVHPDNKAATLCIRGVGDPSMTFSSLSRTANTLNRNFGITHLEQVLVDDSAYLPSFPDGWPWGDLAFDYGAQPGALVVDENIISFTLSPTSEGSPLSISYANPGDAAARPVNVESTTTTAHGGESNVDFSWQLGSEDVFVTGSLPIGSSPVKMNVAAVNPTKRWANVFISALEANNIVVENSFKIGRCGPSSSSSQANSEPKWQEIYTIESDTLGNMVNHTLQVSDNLMAEMWSRYLGATHPAKGVTSGSATTRGIASVTQVLTQQLGVPTGSFRQRDGSGLDCANLVSPLSLVETLKAMGRSSIAEIYRSYLPSSLPGGMLYSRYVGTPAVGRVFAKTGYISLTSSLSGWVDHDKLFSIILDQSNTDPSLRKKIIDQIVVYLADLCPM